jgi:hypothetical protein
METQELITFGGTLTVLAILFSADRVIGYGFIGAGVLISLLGALKARRAVKDRGEPQ